MKKSLLFSLLVSSTIITGGLGTLLAEAAEDAHQSTSDVSFIPGLGVTDPMIPSEDGDGATGHAGSLTIDNVTNLNFGSHKVSASKEIYETISVSPNVQVTDKRGTGAGWDLKVASSTFNTADGTELKGAFLRFKAGRTSTQLNNASASAATHAISFELDGSAQSIMSATADKGLGTWVNLLFNKVGHNDYVYLEVPSGNKAGVYTAELDWSLSDAP